MRRFCTLSIFILLTIASLSPAQSLGEFARRQKELDARDSVGNVTVSQRVLISGTGMGSPGPGLCEFSNEMSSHPYQEWCDEPAKWKADLEKTKEKLQTEQAALEALQEQARQLGFGNSFYDPD